MRLETLVVRMAEGVVRVREEMPLDGRAAGDEALPERALDGGCRDVVLAATEDERRALQCRGELERVARPVRGLRLVANGRVVEDDGAHLRVVGGERDEEAATHAVPDARGGGRIGI